MKKLIFSLLAVSMIFAACSKELTFDEKVVGRWDSVSVKVGGVDMTSVNSVVLNIESSHEFDADLTSKSPIGGTFTSSYTGTWTANEVRQELTLKYDNGEQEVYDILSVDETSMRAELIVDNVRREFLFEKAGE